MSSSNIGLCASSQGSSLSSPQCVFNFAFYVTMNMAYGELSTIFDEAGVSEDVRKFIYDMGIAKTAVFARVATSPAELKESIVTPFFIDQTPTLAVQVVVEATVTAANVMRTAITSAAWAPPTSQLCSNARREFSEFVGSLQRFPPRYRILA